MNIDMNQFMQMAQAKGNPKQMVMMMLEAQSAQNPVLSNLLQLAQNNDSKGIEQFARNVMKERGLDFDKEFEKFKKTYHL